MEEEGRREFWKKREGASCGERERESYGRRGKDRELWKKRKGESYGRGEKARVMEEERERERTMKEEGGRELWKKRDGESYGRKRREGDSYGGRVWDRVKYEVECMV